VEGRFTLDERVSLRDESFGALAYHHGNRRLVFLKSPLLVDVVRQLGNFESTQAALDTLVPAASHPAYVKALEGLCAAEVLTRG
jgi:putative mycofactocin binding protein MftB